MKNKFLTIIAITALISTNIDAKGNDKPKKEHYVTFLGGFGPKGVDLKQNGNVVQINQKRSFVFGAGYSKDVGIGLMVGGQILSNGTLLGTMGLGF